MSQVSKVLLSMSLIKFCTPCSNQRPSKTEGVVRRPLDTHGFYLTTFQSPEADPTSLVNGLSLYLSRRKARPMQPVRFTLSVRVSSSHCREMVMAGVAAIIHQATSEFKITDYNWDIAQLNCELLDKLIFSLLQTQLISTALRSIMPLTPLR